VIAIDGKALRGSRSVARGTGALYLVSAYAADMGLSLGQQPCEAKSNGVEAIEELLPVLTLEGAVVTIDAIGCQTAIASQIVEGGGDYVLAVKDNQPTLATALREFSACLNQPEIIRGGHAISTKPSTRAMAASRRAAARRWMISRGSTPSNYANAGRICARWRTSTRSARRTARSRSTRAVISSLPADAQRILLLTAV
jgi:predicted transposase YbfD/YdcC